MSDRVLVAAHLLLHLVFRLGDILGCWVEARRAALRLRLLQDRAVDLEERFEFTVTPHPGCPISATDYPPLAYKVTHEPLNRILREYVVAYAVNATSAALDALLAGMRVVVQHVVGQINRSPVRNVNGVEFISTAEELASVFCHKGNAAPSGLVDDYFWLDQSLPRWRALVSQQGAVRQSHLIAHIGVMSNTMRSIDVWLNDEQLAAIYSASYWNDVEEEKTKDWWIADGNYQRCLDYLERSGLLHEYREAEKVVATFPGDSIKIADLAAGIGWTSALLSKLPNVGEVHAVDVSRHRLADLFEHSVRMMEGDEEKLNRHLGSFYDLKFEDGSIDLIFLSQAFHHADRPLPLLVECDRVLKAGGESS